MAAHQLSNPSIINIDHGFVTPFLSNPSERSFTGAVYDAKGHICQNSQRTTLGNNEWNPNDASSIKPPSDLSIIKGRSLYLGHYTGHYGHFLIETLSRFWAIHDINDLHFYDNFIFHPFLHECPSFKKFAPAALAFKAFDIVDKNIIIIDRHVGFEKISVPSSLFQINFGVRQEMNNIYKKLVHHSNLTQPQRRDLRHIFRYFNKAPASDKIYLSRRRTKGYHPMINEKEVESVFKHHGFFILHPEHYSYQDQLILLNKASVLAGAEGSGLHNSVFMTHGQKVIQIGTPREPSGDIFNQRLCNSLSNVISHHIPYQGNIARGNKAVYDLNFIHKSLGEIL
jgi:capsular polysaccharide biosynthesis protein